MKTKTAMTAILKSRSERETVLPYDLGGKTDPYFADHGGNFIADRIVANEERYAEENCWCYIEHGQLVAESCCPVHGDSA